MGASQSKRHLVYGGHGRDESNDDAGDVSGVEGGWVRNSMLGNKGMIHPTLPHPAIASHPTALPPSFFHSIPPSALCCKQISVQPSASSVNAIPPVCSLHGPQLVQVSLVHVCVGVHEIMATCIGLHFVPGMALSHLMGLLLMMVILVIISEGSGRAIGDYSNLMWDSGMGALWSPSFTPLQVPPMLAALRCIASQKTPRLVFL